MNIFPFAEEEKKFCDDFDKRMINAIEDKRQIRWWLQGCYEKRYDCRGDYYAKCHGAITRNGKNK